MTLKVCKYSFLKRLFIDFDRWSYCGVFESNIFRDFQYVREIYANSDVRNPIDNWQFVIDRNPNLISLVIPLEMTNIHIPCGKYVKGLKEFGIFMDENTSVNIQQIIDKWLNKYNLEHLYIWNRLKSNNLFEDPRITYF